MTEDSTKLDNVEREYRAMLAKMTRGDCAAGLWRSLLGLVAQSRKVAGEAGRAATDRA